MGATGGKYTHATMYVAVGVGGLVEADTTVDLRHIEVHIFVTGSNIDVDQLEVGLVVGIVDKGSLEGIKESHTGVADAGGAEYTIARQVDIEGVLAVAGRKDLRPRSERFRKLERISAGHRLVWLLVPAE